MNKEEKFKEAFRKKYLDLVEQKPWQKIQEHFNSVPAVDIKPVANIKINTSDWVQWTLDNIKDSEGGWEQYQPDYTDDYNAFGTLNMAMGRNIHNSYIMDWGKCPTDNRYDHIHESLKELVGYDNIKMLGSDPESVLIRLLVKMPGHGQPWHADEVGKYFRVMPHIKETAEYKRKRWWFSVADWSDGHVFQISRTVLSNWKAGDVYEIPDGIGHASSNFGYVPQMTVAYTSLVKINS